MRFSYDESTDSLYIHFVESAGVDTVVINEDVVADIDADGKMVGLDIQYASKTAQMDHAALADIMSKISGEVVIS